MLLLIDGYNVVKQAFAGQKSVMDKQRMVFIKQLAYYKFKKETTISDVIVVFDAGPLSHATREVRGGIVVIFSGQKSSADEWIEQYSKKHQAQDVLLISSDRKLVDACQRYGVKHMPSPEFYAIIQEVLAKDAAYNDTQIHDLSVLQKYGPSDTITGAQDNERYDARAVDLLMTQASIDVPEKDDSNKEQQHRRGNARMLSKGEKKIVSTLKKLK